MLERIQPPVTSPQQITIVMQKTGFGVLSRAGVNHLMGLDEHGLDLNQLK